MNKSAVLCAVSNLPGDWEAKSVAYSRISLAGSLELEELAQYSDDPRDIAIYLADLAVTDGIIAEISSVRAISAILLIGTEDIHNNVGRKCSQPWDISNRQWVVMSYLKTHQYVICNPATGEYRIVSLVTMGNLY